MISQTAEYALRAIVYLADQSGEARTIRQVAAATQVPGEYLAKVLGNLKRAGITRAKRGLHGGYTLARSPEQITILDIINVVDPFERIRHCPLGNREHVDLCPLHRRLDGALAQIEAVFASTTVAELQAESSARPSIRKQGQKECGFPSTKQPAAEKRAGDGKRPASRKRRN